MYTPYVRNTTGNFYTVLDAKPTNPLGAIYSPPPSQSLPSSTNGFGAQPVYKYVQYNSTANPATVAAPAPVFWTNESFTVVSAVNTEAMGGTATAVSYQFGAGYLLANNVAVSGFTNLLLNTSYCWIQIGGFLAGAWVPTGTAVGDSITPTAGNWTSLRTAAGTAPAINAVVLGRALTAAAAITGGFSADLLVGDVQTFWGS